MNKRILSLGYCKKIQLPYKMISALESFTLAYKADFKLSSRELTKNRLMTFVNNTDVTANL